MRLVTRLIASSLILLASHGAPASEDSARAPGGQPLLERLEAQVVAPLRLGSEAAYAFTRARIVPRDLVTTADETLSRDPEGRDFLVFRIEERSAVGRTLVAHGCYYPAEDQAFLQRGAAYVPAARHPLLAAEPPQPLPDPPSRCRRG